MIRPRQQHNTSSLRADRSARVHKRVPRGGGYNQDDFFRRSTASFPPPPAALSHPLVDRAINPARKLNVGVDSSFDFFPFFFRSTTGTIIKYNAGSVSGGVSQIIVVCDTLRLACQLATVYEVTKYAGSLHHAHRPASSRAIRATRSFPIVRQSHQLIPVQGRIYI